MEETVALNIENTICKFVKELGKTTMCYEEDIFALNEENIF